MRINDPGPGPVRQGIGKVKHWRERGHIALQSSGLRDEYRLVERVVYLWYCLSSAIPPGPLAPVSCRRDNRHGIISQDSVDHGPMRFHLVCICPCELTRSSHDPSKHRSASPLGPRFEQNSVQTCNDGARPYPSERAFDNAFPVALTTTEACVSAKYIMQNPSAGDTVRTANSVALFHVLGAPNPSEG